MPAYFEPKSGAATIAFDRGVTVFGCDSACDVHIADSKLSPRHFAIAKLASSHIVCDLGTDSGVSINGERVVGRQPVLDKDVVSVGELAFVYRSAEHAVTAPLISPKMFPRLRLANVLPRREVVATVEEQPEKPQIKPIRVRPGARTAAPKTTDDIEPDPNQPAAVAPQPKPRPKMRRRHSDQGTRAGDRRKLLANGSSRSKGKSKPQPVRLIDATCPHCKFEFCHVKGGAGDEGSGRSSRVECQKCSKKVVLKSVDEIPVVEKRWSQPTWNSIVSGFDVQAKTGSVIVFLVMVQFTVMAGLGVGKFGSIATSLFFPIENTENHGSTSLVAACIATIVFAMAPIVILAATRVIAENFTTPLLIAVILGCLITPLLWRADNGIPIARFGLFLYAISALAIVTGGLKLADTSETGLTRTIPIALGGFGVSSLILFVGCFVALDNTGRVEIIGSHRLAMWAIGAGILWVTAQVCQLQYQRGVSRFLREPMLTKSIEECSVFTILLATVSFIVLVMLATGTAEQSVSDFCWLAVGFCGVLNVMWFLQVARFTRYAIR